MQFHICCVREVRQWATEQQRATDRYLQGTGLQAQISARVADAVRRERRGLPISVPNHRFEQRRTAEDEQMSLFVVRDERAELLIDPAETDPTGQTALTMASPSPDGAKVAWGSARSGSDWHTIAVREVSTGADLPDRLTWIKAAQAAWTDDAQGFYYLGFEPVAEGTELLAENSGQEIRYHRLGTPQSQDTPVFRRPGAHWLSVTVPRGSGYVVVEATSGTTTVAIAVAEVGTTDFTAIVDGDDEVAFLGYAHNSFFYISYGQDASGQVVRARLEGDQVHTETVPVPPGHLEAWNSTVTGNFLVLAYTTGSPQGLVALDLRTRNRHTLIEERGVLIEGVSAVESEDSIDLLCSGYGLGQRLLRQDLEGAATTLFDSLETRNRVTHTEVRSADGTHVPLVIVEPPMPADGPRPTLLVAYGGYGADFLSYGFEDWHQVWIDCGGVIALAGIRGGSEHGDAWHLAAVRENKPRCFEDLEACAEHLISTGVTESARLGLNGMSNGGLVVAAVMNRRPDLFGAVVAEVGVMDMLQFHRYTVGAGWIREFGDPDDPDDREYLLSYSPLHNLRDDVDYPPTLVVTGDHDDRVVPGVHSYRYHERLQQVTRNTTDHLLRVQPDAGHAAGKSTSTQIAERSDILTFLADRLGLSLPASHQN